MLVNQLTEDNSLLEMNTSEGGDSLFIGLSQEGKERAKELDRLAYTSKVNGADITYSNSTMNYFVGGEISFDKFIFGFRAWKRKEGFGTIMIWTWLHQQMVPFGLPKTKPPI